MAGKADIIEKVAEKVEGLSKKQAGEVFEAVIDAITGYLKKADRVQIPGFGSFAVSSRKARKGRNPKTGAAITIKASKSVRFRNGRELKEALNKGKK